jgi:uncharacterized protein YheU (UPF0270 family)
MVATDASAVTPALQQKIAAFLEQVGSGQIVLNVHDHKLATVEWHAKEAVPK